MLDWDDLRIFLAVGQHGSLNGAAKVLGFHRSTVLRRIDRLEKQIGQRLFDRSPDGVTLTAAGERLLPHAENMADQTAGMLRVADVDHGRPAGAIRVGTTFNLAFGLLPRTLARFRVSFPEITVDLVATPDGYGPVHPDDIDIAFRTLETGTKGHDEMVGRQLGSLPVALYGSEKYFAEFPPPQQIEEIATHRIVTGGDNLSHIAAMRWLASKTGGLEPVYRASSMLLLLAAARDGVGVACLPRYLGDRETGLRRAIDLPAEVGAELWLLRHPHHRDTARMRAFSDFMSAYIPELL
jgi:DNA-binding transcriptional LysR family regulator